jgi:GxxExxY protein
MSSETTKGTKDTKDTKRISGGEAELASKRVIGAAIEVHRTLGPGHPESVYELAMAVEMELRGIRFQRQAVYSVTYKGSQVGEGRLDFLVEGCLIVELKATEELAFVHMSQVVSYLKATDRHLALLLNFNVPLMTAGIKRVVL